MAGRMDQTSVSFGDKNYRNYVPLKWLEYNNSRYNGFGKKSQIEINQDTFWGKR